MNYPQQGWQPQQYIAGPPGPAAYGQQQPQVAQPLTATAEEFWSDNGGGGGGAPSYDFRQHGDTVSGTIVSQQARQRTDPKTREPKFNQKDGRPQMQLEITLQTDLRNWDKVKNVPLGPPAAPGQQGQPLPPQADTGLRRIYAWYTLRDAIAEATGNQSTQVGAHLAVRYVGDQPPSAPGLSAVKLYQARYQAPSDADQFFGQQQVPGAPPAGQPAAQYVQQQMAQPGMPHPQYDQGGQLAPGVQQYTNPGPGPQYVQQVPQSPTPQQWQPPQGVPGGYAQAPAVQQAQVPGVASPQQGPDPWATPAQVQPYPDQPPF